MGRRAAPNLIAAQSGVADQRREMRYPRPNARPYAMGLLRRQARTLRLQCLSSIWLSEDTLRAKGPEECAHQPAR